MIDLILFRNKNTLLGTLFLIGGVSIGYMIYETYQEEVPISGTVVNYHKCLFKNI